MPSTEDAGSTVLDLAAARRWAVTARALLAQARDRIDALNVFPVPDGDTGSNLFLTVDGALDLVRGQHQVAGAPLRLHQGLALLARGMLLSARGNSGVILSQLAKGMADAVADAGHQAGQEAEEVGPDVLADAFERAADVAWAGVSRPVEGTILSVATAAATAARGAVLPGATTYEVVAAALAAARTALELTPEQLPRLAAAGVVDAGGAGLVLVIEALEIVLSDRPREGQPVLAQWWEQLAPGDIATQADLHGDTQIVAQAGGATDVHTAGPDAECAAGDGDYEVMYLVQDSDPERAHHLRAHLVRTGSSVMVVGGPREWRIHVHLDEPGPAVEAGSLAGRVEQVAITPLRSGEQHRDGLVGPQQDRPVAALGVVACAPGEGLAALLAHAGAEVVHSSARARASTGQLLGAARAVAAAQVVILPNDPDTILAAEAAARAAAEEGLQVRVLPTRAVVQGMAAMAVCELEGEVEHTLVAMADAAAGVVYAALTVADNDGSTPVGPCRAGQWLALVGGDIVAVQDALPDAARYVLGVLSQRVAGEPEILTVVAGRSSDPGSLDAEITRWSRSHPEAEVRHVDGGQRTFAWLMGLE